MNCSLVIPNYRGWEHLSRLLAALVQMEPGPREILVVDDASPDFDDTRVAPRPAGLRIIRNDRNMGFAATANRGMGESRSEFVALLNNDTVPATDWLGEALKPFDEASVGSVATRILYLDPPDRIDSAGDTYSVAGGAKKRCERRPAEESRLLPDRTFSACAASAVYRREALDQVGLFDEDFEAYYDDVDLGWRLQLAGWDCAYADAAVCRHAVSASYQRTSWRYAYNSSRNAEIVWWANMPLRGLIRYFPAHLAFLALQSANKLRQRCLLAHLVGKLAFLGRLPRMLAKRGHLRKLRRRKPHEVLAVLESHWFRLHALHNL